MPHVPQDPEPHSAGQQLRMEDLVFGRLGGHPVLGLDVRAAACPASAIRFRSGQGGGKGRLQGLPTGVGYLWTSYGQTKHVFYTP